jgi:superoxide reductase
MNDRRDFLKTAAFTANAVTLASTGLSFASGTAGMTNIIYTKENPGQWKGKEGSHAPQVTVSGNSVAVETKHPMSVEHFIVRHTLVLEDGTFVGGKTFTPADKPESTFELPAGYKGKICVTSFCNKHDFWLSEATV